MKGNREWAGFLFLLLYKISSFSGIFASEKIWTWSQKLGFFSDTGISYQTIRSKGGSTISYLYFASLSKLSRVVCFLQVLSKGPSNQLFSSPVGMSEEEEASRYPAQIWELPFPLFIMTFALESEKCQADKVGPPPDLSQEGGEYKCLSLPEIKQSLW